jgi:hypothetical protein
VRVQLLRPREIGFGFGQLSLEARYLRIQSINLQRQFLIRDRRHGLILLDPITLANRELHDGPADASAGWDDLGAFDRRKHSLLVCNRLRRNDDGILGKCPLAQHR